MRVTNRSIMLSPRIAGSVRRYHTWPTLREQTIADHTFHVLRIWMQLWGAPRADVTEYIVAHDMGELGSGDVPFGAKRRHPDLKAAADNAELASKTDMWGDFGIVFLTDEERARVKICDLLEMFEFGLLELAMGNTLAEPIVDETWAAVEKLCTEEEIQHITRSMSGGILWSRR